MLIQGEIIDYLNVEEIVESIFGDSMHQKRQQSFANAVLGVISSASLCGVRGRGRKATPTRSG